MDALTVWAPAAAAAGGRDDEDASLAAGGATHALVSSSGARRAGGPSESSLRAWELGPGEGDCVASKSAIGPGKTRII